MALNALLDDPSKNTAEYLENRTLELLKLDESELKKLGESGKERREEEDEAEIARLREKHRVG